MGRAREPYWYYVKSIIKEYPVLEKELATPLSPRLCATLEPSTGRKTANPTQDCVIHDLPPKQQRKYDAVSNAILKTRLTHPKTAADRLKVIDMVYWKQSHTVAGAAMKVPCHRNIAGKWQGDFIRLVAEELDLV